MSKNDEKSIPEGSVGSPLGGIAGLKPEKPAPAHSNPACFVAIFCHFGIILVFFSEAVFHHGLQTVFS